MTTLLGSAGSFHVTVKDEATNGDVFASFELLLQSQQISVRDLIKERVHQEVRSFNASTQPRKRFVGLVAPDEKEAALNGSKENKLSARKHAVVNAESQTAIALQAFERGHVLLIVDNSQVTQLDKIIEVGSNSEIVFLKLIALVGG